MTCKVLGWHRRVLVEELCFPSLSWYIISSLSPVSGVTSLSLMFAVANSWEDDVILECPLEKIDEWRRYFLPLFYYIRCS